MDRIGSGLIVPIMLAAVLAVIPGCVTINLPPGPGPLKEEVLSGTGGDKILLVDLSGVISSQEKDGFISQPSMLSDLKEQLELAAKDDRIKGLLLRINSPGGTVTASDILYHEILSYKRQKKSTGRGLDRGCRRLRRLLRGGSRRCHHGASLVGHRELGRHHVDS